MIRLMRHSFFVEADVERKLSEFVINEPILSMGKYTKIFQDDFASWHSRKHCIMVNSGSSANLILMASLINLGRLKSGARVGVSGVTWSTNIMPIIQLGLVPVLLDVEPGGVNVDQAALIKEIRNLDALFITNVLGLSNTLSEISALCQSFGVQLFEDNCEALGCSHNGALMGNFGVASTASSFVGHHFSTIEGGYVFTDDDELAAMLKVVRAHGWSRNISEEDMELLGITQGSDFDKPYRFEYCGFNVRPSEINAYCGILQLPLLQKYNEIRRERFNVISSEFGDKIYSKNTDNPVFAIPIKAKDTAEKIRIVKLLSSKSIESRPLISGSMGKQPFWRRLYGEISLVNACKVDDCGLYITNDPQLSSEEFTTLVTLLSEVLE